MTWTECLSRAVIFRLAGCCLAALTVISVAGCEGGNPLSGATLYPVKGKVLLPDGKPLTSGQVIFVATKSTITNSANIESDGGFSFKEAGGGGLPEGEYKIRIDPGSSSSVGKGSRRTPEGKLVFDSVFLDEDSSGLSATVTSDEAKNNFELKLVPTASSLQAKQSTGGTHGDR